MGGGLHPTLCAHPAEEGLGSTAVPVLHPAPSLACSHPPCSVSPGIFSPRDGSSTWHRPHWVSACRPLSRLPSKRCEVEGWGVWGAQSSWVAPASLMCRCLSSILVHASAPSWTVPQPGVRLGHPRGILSTVGGTGHLVTPTPALGRASPRAGESIWTGVQQGCAGGTVPQREG